MGSLSGPRETVLCEELGRLAEDDRRGLLVPIGSAEASSASMVIGVLASDRRALS